MSEHLADWRALAAACGWPEGEIAWLARRLRRGEAVVRVAASAIVTRTPSGHRQRTYRDHDPNTFAAARRATDDVPAFVAPEGRDAG